MPPDVTLGSISLFVSGGLSIPRCCIRIYLSSYIGGLSIPRCCILTYLVTKIHQVLLNFPTDGSSFRIPAWRRLDSCSQLGMRCPDKEAATLVIGTPMTIAASADIGAIINDGFEDDGFCLRLCHMPETTETISSVLLCNEPHEHHAF